MIARSQPLVSIVTPIYNEEEYLAECIESVLAQTYQNWDYTIVNNCSTDRSLEIARRYAGIDSRIRIHNNKHFLEMLPNHNAAIRQASPTSKYCKVILGDDWIFPQCLEKMVAVAESHPSVGVVSAFVQSGKHIRLTGLDSRVTLVSGRDACRQFFLEKLFLFGSQTSVLYRADLVRNRDPFYMETELYADFEACFALLQTTDLGFVHEILTFSRPRAGSIGAISADVGMHYGSLLRLLFTYGKQCLTNSEFEEALHRRLNQYYRFLGRRLLVDWASNFWLYHKRAFEHVGLSFSRTRLARAAMQQLCGFFLHPKSSIASVRRLFSLKELRRSQRAQLLVDWETSMASACDDIDHDDHGRKVADLNASADHLGT